MCLFTDNPRPKVAKKPIRVWKRLKIFKKEDEIIYKTPYQYVVVKVGDSLKALDNNTEVQEVDPMGRYLIGEKGVHGYITMSSAKFMKPFNEIITEWIIPIGAKYWIGKGWLSTGEIAATEMKFIKVCD
jgi:hypothetical protein